MSARVSQISLKRLELIINAVILLHLLYLLARALVCLLRQKRRVMLLLVQSIRYHI